MHLLVSGIPGTGKSTFSRWLVSQHGYLRCPLADQDEPGDHFFEQIDATLANGSDVVIDWGFPPPLLEYVRRLVGGGVVNWWFDGDRDAALQSYLSLGKPRSAWDAQLAAIGQRWDQISDVFSGRILQVISTGPTCRKTNDSQGSKPLVRTSRKRPYRLHEGRTMPPPSPNIDPSRLRRVRWVHPNPRPTRVHYLEESGPRTLCGVLDTKHSRYIGTPGHAVVATTDEVDCELCLRKVTP